MAVDSRQKRRSSIDTGIPWRASNLVDPDGTLNQADRQQSTHEYSGILAGAEEVAATAFNEGLRQNIGKMMR